MSNSNEREKYLDALRGIACLIVLLAHILSTIPSVGIRVSGCGKIGVWLFFVLSGFFVYYPWVKNNKKFNWKDAFSFYIKRFFRIYPVYLVVLLVCIFLKYVTTIDALKHLLLLQGYGHFWAIPVEVKFYLIIPVVLIIFTRIKKIYSLALALLATTGLSVLFPYTTYNENSICLFWYLPVLLLGMCTALAFVKLKDDKCIACDLVAILLVIFMVFLIPGVRERVFGIQPDKYLQNKYLYISIIWIIILLCIKKSVYLRLKLEKIRVLQFIGKISYSIYLIHYIVLNYANLYIKNSWIKSVVVISISIALAALSERFIERNAIKAGKLLASKIRRINAKNILQAVFAIIVILGFGYSCFADYRTFKQEQAIILQNTTWEERLYVPTMIEKCGNRYFIIDCWNSRILYSDSCSKNLNDWNVLQQDAYLGGHTVASDGELYVFDNTDMNQVLVYKESEDESLYLTQTFEGIESRPHYALYDEETKRFYVIGSTSGIIYIFKNEQAELSLVNKCILPETKDAYVRSISIIDGDLYTSCGPGKIFQYSIENDSLIYKKEYTVPDCYYGMNQISKIDGSWYFTINTDINGDVGKTTILRADSIEDLSSGKVTDLYDTMGFTGQPYFITHFDDKYWITEISASGGNGIRSFELKDGKPKKIKPLFYWKNVLPCSMERWTTQQQKWAGQVVDLVIFMGQSNMSGKGDAALAPAVSKGWEYRAISDRSCLYPISEPFGIYENNPEGVNDTNENGEYRKLGGMVSAFANGYYETTGVPIVGVSCSEGNTAIEQWMEGTAFYNDAVERLNAAKDYLNSSSEYRLRNVYMVWCQGENNGDNGTSLDDYYNQLKAIVDSLVDKQLISQCFVVTIGKKNVEDGTTYDDIIQAQISLCKDDSNCTLVSTQFISMKDRGMMYDIYHYTQEGYNIVGQEAGKNAGSWVNTGIEPQVIDYR